MQDFIAGDAILQAAPPASQVTTLTNLVVPAAYLDLARGVQRNVMLWQIAQLQAVGAGVPFGAAPDDAADADGGAEEDED